MLAQDNYNFYFNKDICSIYFRNKIITCTFLIDSLYHLHMDVSVNINEQIVNAIGSKRSRDRISQKYLWYFRLNHIGENRLNKLEKDGLLGPLTFESYPVCELCLQEKMIKLLFMGQGERAIEILALVVVHSIDRKSTRLNSSHSGESRMPSSA